MNSKCKAYTVAGLLAWAIIAWLSWHYETKCGSQFGNPCIQYYLSGLRWLLLFKWLYPYQTLVAGLAAVAGALGAIYAARITVKASESSAKIQQRRQLLVDAAYVSEMFRETSQLAINSDFTLFADKWEDISGSLKRLVAVHPKFAVDCIYVWGLVLALPKGQPNRVDLAGIASKAAVASFVLNDIRNHFGSEHSGDYIIAPIEITAKLKKTLELQHQYASSEMASCTVKTLADRMLNYIISPF